MVSLFLNPKTFLEGQIQIVDFKKLDNHKYQEKDRKKFNDYPFVFDTDGTVLINANNVLKSTILNTFKILIPLSDDELLVKERELKLFYPDIDSVDKVIKLINDNKMEQAAECFIKMCIQDEKNRRIIAMKSKNMV